MHRFLQFTVRFSSFALLFLLSLSLPAQADEAASFNRAAFISQQVPNLVTAGQTYTVRITLRNVGTTVWRSIDTHYGYKLGSECPRDNRTWGTNRVFLPPGKEVKPGQTHTFVFDITGPSALGQQCFQWKMVEEGVRWFPDSTPARLIFVHSPSSAQSN